MAYDEEWRQIQAYPEYAASCHGRIKRIAPKGTSRGEPLSASVNLHGYLFVSICSAGKKISKNVHSLVCETFHGPKPTPGHEVAHWDGNALNNRADNLRWATRKENFQDRDRHGRTVRGDRSWSRMHPELLRRGEAHGNAKLSNEDVLAIRSSNERQTDLAARYGIKQGHVSDIRLRKIWRHI